MVVIIMGVSGTGKTTTGKLLATDLSLPFYDADNFHPLPNIEKMKAGIPLDDDDRMPWLQTLACRIDEWAKTNGAVLACSALKESYRTVLKSKTSDVQWICLSGDHALIKSRAQNRKGHFMPETLLASQLTTLEVPDYGLIVDIASQPDRIVASIKQWLING